MRAQNFVVLQDNIRKLRMYDSRFLRRIFGPTRRQATEER